MGAAEPVGSERTDAQGAGFRPKQVFASNTGKCVEDSYPEGSVLLNLGCGDIHWNGWIGCDANPDGWHDKRGPDVVCDITDLPFPNDYADAIAAVHVIEHFYQWEVNSVLKHWKDKLKPGGRLILELPCMDKVFRYITDCINSKMPMSGTFSVLPLWGDPRFKNVAMCHKWGYFYATIREELVKAGFKDIKFEDARYHFKNRDMRVTAVK